MHDIPLQLSVCLDCYFGSHRFLWDDCMENLEEVIEGKYQALAVEILTGIGNFRGILCQQFYQGEKK